jgi:methionyl-tRNA formyltransferase
VQVYDCRREPGDGISSKVMAVADDGVTVQCIGGRIRLLRVRPAGGDKMPAQEWAAQAGVEKGTVLGS